MTDHERTEPVNAEKIIRSIKKHHSYIPSFSLEENILNALSCLYMNGKNQRRFAEYNQSFWKEIADRACHHHTKVFAHYQKVKRHRDRIHAENQRLRAQIKQLQNVVDATTPQNNVN